MAMPIRSRCLPSLRPGTHRNAELGAVHPALPAVVLLVCFSVFMAAIAPLDFTSIIRKFIPTPVRTVPHQDAAVWVVNNAGVYYCPDSIMFGKSKGQYMKQVEAIDRGYQPALGTYCTGPAWHIPSQLAQRPVTKAPPKPVSPTGENPFENPQSKLKSPQTAPPSPQ